MRKNENIAVFERNILTSLIWKYDTKQLGEWEYKL